MSKYIKDDNFMKLLSQFDFGKGPWIYTYLESRYRVSTYISIIIDKVILFERLYEDIMSYSYSTKKEYDQECEEDYENIESVKEFGFDVCINIPNYYNELSRTRTILEMDFLKKEDDRNYIIIEEIKLENLLKESVQKTT